MTKEPLYPFGFGLSTTTFRYGPLRLRRTAIGPDETTTASVELTNAGAIAADEVVQLYVSDLEASVPAPRASLRGIRVVRLEPAESTVVEFAIEPPSLAIVDESGRSLVENGEFRITVGGASPGDRAVALGAPKPAEAVLTVR
jgi:beta-glucosidase